MRFVWGEPKRQANLKKHGFDLADFEEASSFERFIALDAEPSKTGRVRFKLIGSWYDETVVVAIVSPLGLEAIDVVSVRCADRNERALYATHQACARIRPESSLFPGGLGRSIRQPAIDR